MSKNNRIPEITFPELRKLKGKYNLSQSELGKVIGKTYQTYKSKLGLENGAEFTFSEMVKICDYFTQKGEKNITPKLLFFDWLSSNEDREICRIPRLEG